MSLEMIAGELGEALLGLLSGGAVIAMVVTVLNFAAGF